MPNRFTICYANGVRIDRYPSEVALGPCQRPDIPDEAIGLYRMNGNWDIYEVVEVRGSRIFQVGRLLRTVWVS